MATRKSSLRAPNNRIVIGIKCQANCAEAEFILTVLIVTFPWNQQINKDLLQTTLSSRFLNAKAIPYLALPTCQQNFQTIAEKIFVQYIILF